MDEQKSNCEENDSEPTADDNAPSKQLVSSSEESKALPAAEDVSGATAASSSTPVESVRACALCNCVERSLHGQRELRHFGPSSEQLTVKPTESPLPQPGSDDLSSIGFSDSPCLSALFDDSGGCWVHHWCAVWSEGVKRTENEELENVDKAVISGTQRLCEYCKRLGATIQCHAEGCLRFYHFPCSAASGSFQSLKQLFLLCPEHIDKAEELAGEEAWCAVCDSAGELTDLLFCTGCGQHYHAACLEIGATPIQRAGWQCPECKVCQTCRQPGEDSKMLVCDACDKGYHTFCLQPAMDSLPSDPWKCRRCRVCTECGVRGLVLPGAAQWFDNYAVCEACQRHRSSTCGVCSKAANPSVTLQCCSMCHRWVHSECTLPGELPEAKCICLLCKEQQPVTQPYTAEVKSKEACEETEGQVDLVEMTIQADADMVTEEHTNLSEVTPGQGGASELVQTETMADKETPMDLGVESAVVETTDIGKEITWQFEAFKSSVLNNVPVKMGQTLCMCSRGSITIDNKKYYFVQKLDEGGFSYVDLVEGVKDGRFYALKRILCHDREGRQEAQAEVEMHQIFNHPNILSLVAHTFVDRGGKTEAWLLLPYISKGSLWSILEKLRDKGSSMPEKQILQILRGICSGLKAIHEKGYAHRDLKPTNVLLDEDDRPVLMDLGSMNRARIEVRGSREAMTIQDWAAQRCTISYRAPELFNVESHCIIDERTDIWSLGCVLYCMMMLEGPYDMIFQKGDSVALAVQNPVAIPQSCSYSQGLQILLSSIMVSNPQERPNINWVLDQVQDLQSRSPNTQTNMV